MSPRPVKNCAVTVNRSWSLDANVLGVGCRDHYDISVTRRDIIAGSVVLDLWTTEQAPFDGELERDVALEFDCAGDKIAGRDQHSSAIFGGAGVDRFLNGDRVDGRSITDSAKISDVVITRAKIFLFRTTLSGSRTRCDCTDRSRD